MNISFNFNAAAHTSEELIVLGAFCKTEKSAKKGAKDSVTTPILSSWDKSFKLAFEDLNSKDQFTGAVGSSFTFDFDGIRIMAYGLGEKKEYDTEGLRRAAANILKTTKSQVSNLSIDLDSFLLKSNIENTVQIMSEAFFMTNYSFDKYKSNSKASKLTEIIFDSKAKKTALKKAEAALESSKIIGESINIARSFVNEPPNVLNSETYAKAIEKDIKGVKGVKYKHLGKAELKKEKMGMFLSVNAGSAYEPRLVHLTYTPSKVTSKTKHIAFVGKGLTFDTGGYSIKPAGSIINMKFDMAGSSTVYAAFRAAAMLKLPIKISCFLGLTDNAINEKATMPDAIVTARNGMTVEILNTDAEGRLVMGDVLDYACSHKPDAVIDCATLTGACLVALGSEVCAIMGNDNKLTEGLKKAAKSADEYMWELPIIPEWRKDMKSPIADLKNIGGTRFAGTPKAAAFLENFVSEGTSWAHLDIAGIGDGQSHLPYCPPKGGSGLVIRTLVEYLKSQK